MKKACIFDLDGVIVDTAKYHFKAWRRMANELGIDFTEKENEQLKGVSRVDSLNLILKWGGLELPQEKKQEYMDKKNNWYLEYIQQMDESEILEGIMPFLNELQERNVNIVLGSASKNAPTIINQVGLRDYFDAIMDGNNVTKGKPHPEVFLKGAAAVNAGPSECIVFEDAEKGVQAARAGGFWVVGIGEPEVLDQAHLVLPNLVGWDLERLESQLNINLKKMWSGK